MQDLCKWSVSIGRYFGIRVRVHLFFLAFVLIELWADWHDSRGAALRFRLVVMGLLFASVLVHEFGHCFAARSVGGTADQILMWPLGGLAMVRCPHRPRDQFTTYSAGPGVNLAICAAAATVLMFRGFVPPVNPLNPFALRPLGGGPATHDAVAEWTGILFGLNWILFLFNLLPAFPLDGGQMFRVLLWPKLGYVESTLVTVRLAVLVAAGLAVLAVLQQELLLLGVAAFVYISSDLERRRLEAEVMGDESLLGYDFSEGYTSLARSTEQATRRRPGLFERWRRKRARLRWQREQQARAEQEQRVDELLAKVHREGLGSLTRQERNFLTRVSAEYRERLNQ